ncbi:MAG: helix-turn-helix domain-containing protein [Planctomycetia bacterium]|nr:helix-turn-helix domain-containing protein [Planctomycetia bacterium]
MANVLEMMMVEAIHSLRSAGLSCREIARRLGIHRETVSRHLRLVRDPISKPASAPTGNRRQKAAKADVDTTA